MERMLCKLNEQDIIKTNSFFINNINFVGIFPIMGNDMYNLLFRVEETSTERVVYFNLLIRPEDKPEKEVLDNHPNNIRNIKKDLDQTYKELVEDLSQDGTNLFSYDFNMKKSDIKNHYHGSGFRKVDENFYESIEFVFNRDLFVQINLFLRDISLSIIDMDGLFDSFKYKNIELITINHVKLNASAKIDNSNLIMSHYTVGLGPTEFKFRFLSLVLNDKNYRLRNPMILDQFRIFYFNDELCMDRFYYDGYLYLLYYEKSEITKQYKSTKLLKLSKELYDKTNLVDQYKIYEKIEEEQNG